MSLETILEASDSSVPQEDSTGTMLVFLTFITFFTASLGPWEERHLEYQYTIT